MNRPKILIIADWFAPGFKAGGPIQSCVNFAYLMRDTYDIYVYTSDRDLNETQAYPNIKTDEWVEFDERIWVYYFSPEYKTVGTLKKQIAAVSPQYIYLNSLIAPYFAVLPLVLNFIKSFSAKVIVAPRGMLRSTALQYKSTKKKVFLTVARRIGLLNNVFFHATDTIEAQDIRKFFPKTQDIVVVNNPPRTKSLPFKKIEKKDNNLSLLFVGRIHPIKNLEFILTLLSKLSPSVSIEFSIIGQIEDETYWATCQRRIQNLPLNISTKFLGAIPNNQIDAHIQAHHCVILPTQGENFGHAIFESFLNGRPVIISDQTPWQYLDTKGIGWAISLDIPSVWQEKIETAAQWTQDIFEAHCKSAQRFAQDYIQHSDIKAKYERLFS